MLMTAYNDGGFRYFISSVYVDYTYLGCQHVWVPRCVVGVSVTIRRGVDGQGRWRGVEAMLSRCVWSRFGR